MMVRIFDPDDFVVDFADETLLVGVFELTPGAPSMSTSACDEVFASRL